MDNKIHVGHVIRQYLRLTETFIQSYLTHAQKHAPCVLTDVLFHQKGVDTSCVYLIDEHQIAAMGVRERHFFLSELNYPNCYEQTVDEKEIDVLHAHFGSMGYRALTLKNRVHLPLVVSFYGVDASHMLGAARWQKPFQKVFSQADVITVLGTDMANRICDAGCPENKVKIVHLGVDLAHIPYRLRVRPQVDEPIVLLYCGRLVKKKGVLDALHAFARVADQWPHLIFRIVGDGELKQHLVQEIDVLKLGDRVDVLGALPHDRVMKEMQQAHAFVLPSKTAENGDMEGTPTVLLEAQASGLPVLSTHHADIPEVVIDGESGFLVSEGDVEALADKLDVLLSQSDMWDKLGRRGRSHVEKHYNIRREVKRLEAIYQHLV